MCNQATFNKNKISIIAYLIAIIWLIFFFSGIDSVPFHPDESTQIFMSSDLDLILNNTSEMFYSFPNDGIKKQNYRLLDAPLTKYIIGISRVLFNKNSLSNDWDWSKSFEENSIALPDQELLLISRLSLSIFFPFSIFIFYQISKNLFANHRLFIYLSVILFSFNSLLLLHTRRAMAESLLIFFLLLSLYALLTLRSNYLWISSIPIAFSINSKQSLIFLIPVAFLVLVIEKYKNIKHLIIQLTLLLSVIIGISYLLNPIAWQEPITVAKLMIEERNELSENQLSAINSVSPDFTTVNVSEKLTAFIAQTFVLEPALQDISNYQNELQPTYNSYFSNLFHRGIFKNLFFGAISLIITVIGFIVSIKKLTLKNKVIFPLGFLFFLIEILFFINIPFQRYFLPGIPFILLFYVLGIQQIVVYIKNFKS